MSHIVVIQTEVRNVEAMGLACRRLELPLPVYGEAQLFSGRQTGWQVSLPEWRYPVVADVASGQLAFDHFGGRWGDPQHLDRFLQSYAVELAKLEARKQGHTATEELLVDGSIKVTVSVGGAA
ncbi:DUF1257 domain-containing protein [Thalassoroseus pseudoceratinae]|uniref:DUF1257 domain-containing protein n=1 Tax=Thalassoroseus pseudoceratinae TaxID=2713176 RepID=UPI00142125FD|nr:DUF1257 domain-containing protein [Thalassoroseus pseudoceratinae]